MNIYIGFDSTNYGQQLAFDVCKKSMLKYNNNLNINGLYLKNFVKIIQALLNLHILVFLFHI